MRRYCSIASAVLALLLAGCGTHSATQSSSYVNAPPAMRASVAPSGGYNMNAPQSPDPSLTPGAALPVTSADICVSGYTQKVRNVPESIKKQVYAEYGILSHAPGEYEVDHLISLELGGSNSVKNLWPESYQTHPWNAHVKDQLENKLHDMICAGQIDMPTAQRTISTDWISAYKKYFNTSVPLASAPGGGRGRRRSTPSVLPVSTSAAPSAGQVWVNTKSGKYFLPGSSHYGTTRQGAYMSQSAAQQQGYVAAKGE